MSLGDGHAGGSGAVAAAGDDTLQRRKATHLDVKPAFNSDFFVTVANTSHKYYVDLTLTLQKPWMCRGRSSDPDLRADDGLRASRSSTGASP